MVFSGPHRQPPQLRPVHRAHRLGDDLRENQDAGGEDHGKIHSDPAPQTLAAAQPATAAPAVLATVFKIRMADKGRSTWALKPCMIRARPSPLAEAASRVISRVE